MTTTKVSKSDTSHFSMKLSKRVPGYLDLDCLKNALDNLTKTEVFLRQKRDPFRWKWATIALSGSLYGFMIYALGHSNYRAIMKYRHQPKHTILNQLNDLYRDGSAESFAEAWKIEDDLYRRGEMEVISFREALKRIQDSRLMRSYVMSEPVVLTKSERDNVLLLREELRNQFEHLIPMIWSIQEVYFIQPMRDTLTAIDRLCRSGMILSRKLKGAEPCVGRISRLLSIEEKRLISIHKKRPQKSLR